MIHFYVVKFRGTVDSPWLIGMLTLLYTSLASYLVCELLECGNKLWKVFLITAIITLNLSYICSAAVYIYLLDIYALALLFAVISVYVFVCVKNSILRIVFSSLALAASMGLYQSYSAVAVALFIVIFVRKLLSENKSSKEYVLYALKEMLTVGIAGVLYKLSLDLVQMYFHIEPYIDSYNSVSNVFKLTPMLIIKLIPRCYASFFDYFINELTYQSKMYVLFNIFVIVLIIVGYGYSICKVLSKNSLRTLLMLAIIVFPLGANCIFILSNGMIHYLMVYSYQMFYIFALAPYLFDFVPFKKELQKYAIVVVMISISFIVIRFSNSLFYYQKLVGNGTEASVINVLYDIERDSEFDASNMEIVVIGNPSASFAQNYEQLSSYDSYPGIKGWGKTITYKTVFEGYLHYILGRNYRFNYSDDVVDELVNRTEYKEMSTYPCDGYVKVIDNYLVIKFK